MPVLIVVHKSPCIRALDSPPCKVAYRFGSYHEQNGKRNRPEDPSACYDEGERDASKHDGIAERAHAPDRAEQQKGQTMRVLLIEDSRCLADAVAHVLKQAGYAVDTALDGEEGLGLACSGSYDVVVLDIMLPKKDGIAVLCEMRAANIATPVLLLTAKSQVEDRVRGLDAGADDYLTKPFHADELQARLRACARRPREVSANDAIPFADAVLDMQTMQVVCGGRTETLRPTDAHLLELLARNDGIIVSKERIIAKLWGPRSAADANRVEVHVSRVRKALARVGTSASVRTVRGVGYTLAERKG